MGVRLVLDKAWLTKCKIFTLFAIISCFTRFDWFETTVTRPPDVFLLSLGCWRLRFFYLRNFKFTFFFLRNLFIWFFIIIIIKSLLHILIIFVRIKLFVYLF